MARESVLDWASESAFLEATVGAGTTGDTIGTTMGGWSTTTIRTFRVAGQSSIAMVLVRIETSIMVAILMAGVLTGIKDFVGPTPRTRRQPATREPSVGSRMAELREATLCED